uniref:Putative transposase n=1 Tax=viral metagenome TaxID=1070528 RepID=A0A6H1Z907_9ZZZZ
MILGQRIRLDPNNVQRTWFERCAGAARRTWNDGLARWQEVYKAGGKPNWRGINAEFNARKKDDLAWLCELPWAVPNNALRDLGAAFSNFFRRVKQGGKPGYPRFKKRGQCREGFAIEARALRFDGRKVKLPKLGWIRMFEPLRCPGKIISSRFTKHSGRWYVSLMVEIYESWSYPHPCETQASVGVDLGVVDLAVLSDGTRVAAPRALRRHETKLRMLNKQLSRRTRGGANWRKTKVKLGRLHERIADIRKDVTHNLTARLVHDFRWIGIEDLCVKGMARGRLSKSVLDAAMSEVRRQLVYKAPLAGSNIVLADRFYPSSKTCSACGVLHADLHLGDRRWTCEDCGAEHDRDENAAENLKQMAAAHAVAACCPGSAGPLRRAKLPVGQESSSCVNLG